MRVRCRRLGRAKRKFSRPVPNGKWERVELTVPKGSRGNFGLEEEGNPALPAAGAGDDQDKKDQYVIIRSVPGYSVPFGE